MCRDEYKKTKILTRQKKYFTRHDTWKKNSFSLVNFYFYFKFM